MDHKRTIDELLAAYTLEPTLRDIYVEGTTDRAFVEWYLRASGVDNVLVFQIDDFDIPEGVILRNSLPLGSNRSAVMTLAYELSGTCGSDVRVLCVVDRDFSDYLPSRSSCSFLELTDGNSLELYAFRPQVMRKFVSIVLGGFPIQVEDLMASITSILGKVYAYRLANELLGWSMQWIPFEHYITVKKRCISFDEQGFVSAYLQKNKKWASRVQFLKESNIALDHLASDADHRIRGHDLSTLLLPVVRALCRRRSFGNAETLEGSLLASVERDRKLPRLSHTC